MKTIDRTNDRLITIPAALGVEGAVDTRQRQRVREVSDDGGITWRVQSITNIGEPTRTAPIATANPVTPARRTRLADLMDLLVFDRDWAGSTSAAGLINNFIDEVPEHYAGKTGQARLTRDLKAAVEVRTATRRIAWKQVARTDVWRPPIEITVDLANDAKARDEVARLDRDANPYDFDDAGVKIVDTAERESSVAAWHSWQDNDGETWMTDALRPEWHQFRSACEAA